MPDVRFVFLPALIFLAIAFLYSLAAGAGTVVAALRRAVRRR